MRTTIHIPDDLFAEVQKLSAESHITVTALIEEALRERLSRRQQKPQSKPLRLTTYGEGGLQPVVDLDDSTALLDLMEPNLDSHRR